MTNAEKFKEVFGIDFEYNLENVCPRPHTGVCYYDDDGDEDCDTCVYEYWENNEYQGEPTIPLSVIEKIKAEIMSHEETCNKAMNDKEWLTQTNRSAEEFKHYKLAYENCLGVIDNAVKECTHE